MNYTKEVKVKDFKITSLGGDVAEIGAGVDAIMQFDYFESIFKPAVEGRLLITSRTKIISTLPIIGTERVELTIDHPSKTLEFTEWVVQGASELSTSSTQTVTEIILTTPQNIVQELEQFRLTSRYEPNIKISGHVTSILSGLNIPSDSIDIEATANSYGFYGNFWRPFKAIYWLAKRSISTGGGDRAGFLFWQTFDGYKFKSIDTIASQGKEDAVSYRQVEYVGEETDNFRIFNPLMEYNQNIIRTLRTGGYGDKTLFFNPYGLPQNNQPSDQHEYNSTFGKTDSFGTDDLQERGLGVGSRPTNVDVQPYVGGTMTTNGTIEEEDDSGSPQKWLSQSNIRYQQMLSQSQRVTLPMNLDLSAGDPIDLKLISPNEGLDSHESGVYLIKDIRHTVSFTNGVECYSHLRCIRDNYGNETSNTSGLLNS